MRVMLCVRQVRDLSLNFWLIVPALAPASAPDLHPCLEGLFNLLLAWAGLFAGFLIDGKVRTEIPTALAQATAS